MSNISSLDSVPVVKENSKMTNNKSVQRKSRALFPSARQTLNTVFKLSAISVLTTLVVSKSYAGFGVEGIPNVEPSGPDCPRIRASDATVNTNGNYLEITTTDSQDVIRWLGYRNQVTLVVNNRCKNVNLSNYTGVRVYLGAGNDVYNGGSLDIVQEIYGENGKDKIFTGPQNDIIDGGHDNDTIDGGEGEDSIDGDSGNDIIVGGLDNDTIRGGTGNDDIDGGYGNDTVVGGLGNDTIYGGTGHDIIKGNAGKDIIYGEAGNDDIHGGYGNDTIDGGEGEDSIDGYKGNDIIVGGLDIDTIYGGSGHDIINGNEGNDILHGGTGNDAIYGDDGRDTIFGDEGKDDLYGNIGNDVIDGGADEDKLYGNEGQDGLIGGSGDDELYGDIGRDELNGGQGNDYLDGGEGDDLYTGGPGIDGRTEGGESWGPFVPEFHTAVDYNEWRDGRDELLSESHSGLPSGYSTNLVDTDYGAFAYVNMPEPTTSFNDLSVSLELASHNGTAIACFKRVVPSVVRSCHRWNDKNVTLIVVNGSSGADNIFGQYVDVPIVVNAGAGKDTILGGPANDTLKGEAGDDRIVGGRGNDLIYGGGDDDTLEGNQGEDVMWGGSGDDNMWGHEHADLMFGESGHRDRMRGGSGHDVMLDTAGGAWSKKTRMWGESGDDIIVNVNGSSELYGGGGNDFIAALDKNDDQGLYGGDNDDWIYNRGDMFPNGGGGSGYNYCYWEDEYLSDCDMSPGGGLSGMANDYSSAYNSNRGNNRGAYIIGFGSFVGGDAALENAIKGLADNANGTIWVLGDLESNVLDSFWTNWD